MRSLKLLFLSFFALIQLSSCDDLNFNVETEYISCNPKVGGQMINVDSTALILAGSQMTAAWVLPVLVAGAGFAIVIARKF